MGAAQRITVDEWRAEVERVMGRTSDDGMTANEIAGQSGKGVDLVRRWLGALNRAGRLCSGKRAGGVSIDGRPITVPVYWLKKK